MICGDAKGTNAGYRRHVTAREAACDECRAAHAAHKREWRWRTGRNRPMTPPECGTISGRTRHQQAGEPPCEACRAAFRTWQRRHRYRTLEPPRMATSIIDVLTTQDRWLTAELVADLVHDLHPEWKWISIKRRIHDLTKNGIIEARQVGDRIEYRADDDAWDRVA